MGTAIESVRRHKYCSSIPILFLSIAVPVFVLGGSLLAAQVPRDFGVMALVLFVVVALELVLGRLRASVTMRGAVYATATFIVYLAGHYPIMIDVSVETVEWIYFGSLAVAIALAVRCSREREFKTTPMDYLMMFVVLTLGVFSGSLFQGEHVGSLVVEGIIMLYGCELLLHRDVSRWNALSLASLGALGVLAVRGLV